MRPYPGDIPARDYKRKDHDHGCGQVERTRSPRVDMEGGRVRAQPIGRALPGGTTAEMLRSFGVSRSSETRSSSASTLQGRSVPLGEKLADTLPQHPSEMFGGRPAWRRDRPAPGPSPRPRSWGSSRGFPQKLARTSARADRRPLGLSLMEIWTIRCSESPRTRTRFPSISSSTPLRPVGRPARQAVVHPDDEPAEDAAGEDVVVVLRSSGPPRRPSRGRARSWAATRGSATDAWARPGTRSRARTSASCR